MTPKIAHYSTFIEVHRACRYRQCCYSTVPVLRVRTATRGISALTRHRQLAGWSTPRSRLGSAAATVPGSVARCRLDGVGEIAFHLLGTYVVRVPRSLAGHVLCLVAHIGRSSVALKSHVGDESPWHACRSVASRWLSTGKSSTGTRARRFALHLAISRTLWRCSSVAPTIQLSEGHRGYTPAILAPA